MAPEPDLSRSERIAPLFALACDLDPASWPSVLEAQCDDAGVRAEVLGLLRADADPLPVEAALSGSLAGLGASAAVEGSPIAGLPERIGGFRIIRALGSGATGTVLEAEQDLPRRRVALKVLRADDEASRMGRRFRREADILGRLDDPGTARIYQAGTIEIDGRHRAYIAMELVEGEPLVQHAVARDLGIRERVELMARTCDAVGHAHAAGIVHRDLKPQNVLVTRAGQPKVLDFGIARHVGADVAATATEAHGHLFGTLAYVAPEQLAPDAGPADARSDVHALGVLLHEVLVGHPFGAARSRSVADLVRAVREEEPPLLGSIDRKLRGGIESVAAKAMEKDPSRRYPDAAAMGADLRRCLAREPALARRFGPVRRASRVLHRHRAAAVTAAGMTSALLLGLAFTSLMWSRARRHEQEARRAADDARWQSPRRGLRAAASALEAGEVATAAEDVAALPADRSGWSTGYLRAQLDASVDAVSLGDVPVVALVAEPDGVLFAQLDDGTFRRITGLGGGPVVARLDEAMPARQGSPVTARTTLRGMEITTDAGITTVDLGGRPSRWALDASGSRLLAVVREPVEVVLWDRTSGIKTVVGAVHDPIWSIAVDDAGLRGALGTEYGSVWLLDLAGGAPPRELKGAHGGRVRALAMSASGDVVLSGARDHSAATWDFASGRRIATLRAHVGEVSGAALSRDGTRAFTASLDRSVRAWAADGRLPATCLGSSARATCVAAWPDGEMVAAGSEDGSVRTWRLSLVGPASVLAGHESFVYDVAATRDLIASGAWDGTVRLWDAATGAPEGLLAAGPGFRFVRSVAFDPAGEILACGGDGTQGPGGHGHLTAWHVSSRRPAGSLAVPARVVAIAWAPDGIVLAALEDGLVIGWDPRTASVVRRMGAPGAGAAHAIAADARGSRVAVGHADGTITLCDARSLEPRTSLRGRGDVADLAFSPDGRLLASASSAGEIITWDLEGGGDRVLARLGDEAYAVAFSPDGTLLAAGGADAALRVFDVARGDELLVLRGHASYVHAACFTPDGDTLVSGSGDGTVRAWHARSVSERLASAR